MKLIVVLALLAVAMAAPQGDPRSAVITDQTFNNVGFGPWSWSYKTSDGVTREEEGRIVDEGTENEAIEIKGKVSWIGADGQTYTLVYISDRNGFQPAGTGIGGGVSNPALASLLG